MHSGMLGGIIGSVIGILGGVVGTYCSIANTKTPRERIFVKNCAAVAWVAILGFLGLVLLLPTPYRWLPWIPYVVAIPFSVNWMNKSQARIRSEEDAKCADENPTPADAPRDSSRETA